VPLARPEARVALSILLRRLQTIELAERAAPTLTGNTFLRGVTRLPLRLQAHAA